MRVKCTSPDNKTGFLMDVDDLVTESITQDTRANRTDSHGELERINEHTEQVAQALGRLVDHLADRGMFTAKQLDELFGLRDQTPVELCPKED